MPGTGFAVVCPDPAIAPGTRGGDPLPRFFKLDMQDGLLTEYIDRVPVVHVRETHAHKSEGKPHEVHSDLSGGATVRLSGAPAVAFLKQFEAHINRMHPSNVSGPGHSALSP